MLALAQPAEAKIVYTKSHVVINSANQQIYWLDLNHDGVGDFEFVAGYGTTQSGQVAGMHCVGTETGNVWGRTPYDSALPGGVEVGPKGRFGAHDGRMVSLSYFRGQSKFAGPWANGGRGVKNRYLGLRFKIKGQTHFGWARLSVTVVGQPPVNITGTLTG
jgi:hypothetical protein